MSGKSIPGGQRKRAPYVYRKDLTEDEWRDHLKARSQRIYARSRRKRNAGARRWKANNKDRVREYRANYYAANKAKEKTGRERWLEQNKESYAYVKAASDKRYRERNHEKIRAARIARNPQRLAQDRERYKTDTQYRLDKILRAALGQAIRLQGISRRCRVIDLIGCSVDDLRRHLEGQFEAGMAWANHSREGWHIDHIRPCASFDLTDLEQQKECFHYTNLRPRWAESNISKGSHWNGKRWTRRVRDRKEDLQF